jgi:uncharacterized repeat protein (TIGR03803 family)
LGCANGGGGGRRRLGRSRRDGAALLYGGPTDGAAPYDNLIADSSGNLYGTAILGGGSGCGVVFKLVPGGTETVLYSFTGGSDGGGPGAGLIADSSGNLYGTTEGGGVSGCGGTCGVVFKLAPPATASGAWTETVLHAFTGSPSDGGVPYFAGLIADSSGNLYGTTYFGGTSNDGVVFKLTPPATASGAWTETVLYSFCSLSSCSDGEYPYAGLIADSSGNLYGTTFEGGASGEGTVFKLTPGGTEKVLYSFKGYPSDGSFPYAGLIADSSGNLYGATYTGGNTSDGGVVFKLTPPATASGAWTETVLYYFCSLSSCSDGADPYAGLIADSSGNLYGTTAGGGARLGGTVFKLTPPATASGAWTETVLYSFCSLSSCSDGAYPEASLIADSSGNLYSTTPSGGASGAGVVFKLTGTGFTTTTPFRGRP